MPQDEEQIGSKTKRWFRDPDDTRWLFKEVRGLDRPLGPEGEDWAEKIASELARLMGIPTARVELAVHDGRRGIISKAVVAEAATLVHGDELLEELDPTYDRFQHGAATGMTISSVWTALEPVLSAPGTPIHTTHLGARFNMAAYLVFDALIANTDRHHSNWAVIRRAEESRSHDVGGASSKVPHRWSTSRSMPSLLFPTAAPKWWKKSSIRWLRQAGCRSSRRFPSS